MLVRGGDRERNAKEDLEYATSYEEEEQIRNNSFEKKKKKHGRKTQRLMRLATYRAGLQTGQMG